MQGQVAYYICDCALLFFLMSAWNMHDDRVARIEKMNQTDACMLAALQSRPIL